VSPYKNARVLQAEILPNGRVTAAFKIQEGLPRGMLTVNADLSPPTCSLSCRV
jgi:hypothetical protein